MRVKASGNVPSIGDGCIRRRADAGSCGMRSDCAEHESEEGGGLLGAEKVGALARPRAACGRQLCV